MVSEAVVERCSVKKDVLRNFTKFTGKHLCQSLFFLSFFYVFFNKKETLAQVFSSELCVKFLRTPFLQNTSGGCFCAFGIEAGERADHENTMMNMTSTLLSG